MKFGRLIFKKEAPEWREAYLNYKLMKCLLKPLKIHSKIFLNILLKNRMLHNTNIQSNNSHLKFNITNFTKEDFEKLKEFNDKFEILFSLEVEKINYFFKSKLIEYLAKFEIFKINASILKTMREDPNYSKFHGELKNCFNLFYKEIDLLSKYYFLNYEGIRKLLKKKKKLINAFPIKLNFTNIKFDQIFPENSFIYKYSTKLQKLKQNVESLYIDLFFGNQKLIGKSELKKISYDRLISNWENFYFGLFSGFMILLCLVILILGIKKNFDPDIGDQFNNIFPVFRGFALFIIYFWLLAWNVYGWTKYHINYKLIFRFNYHFSTLSEILKRAAFFTTIFLISLLFYILFNKIEINTHFYPFSLITRQSFPFFGWIFLIIYIFFPKNNWFNGEGRFYMFKILKKIFLFSCCYVDFTMAWVSNQMVSFVIPIRDLEFTICYSIQSIFDPINVAECNVQEKYTIAFIAAFLPSFLRIIQCIKLIYQTENRFVFNTEFFNMIKYLLIMTTILLGLVINLDKTNDFIFYIWILFATITSLYAYYWDLKMDWGFLDKNAKNKYLRNQLSYDKTYFYYIAIIINLAFRFSWILTLSPSIIDKAFRRELFTFLLGFIEMTRRAIWNFFRVEKEHITNCGLFRVVEVYKLPFQNLKYNIDERKLILSDFENLDVEFLIFDGKSPFSIDYDEIKNKVRDSHSLFNIKDIKKDVLAFKTYLTNKNNQFIISNKNDISFSVNKKKNCVIVSTFHGDDSVDNINENDEYEENKPEDRIRNKLHRSINKFINTFEDDDKREININFLKEIINKFEKKNEKNSFEIEKN